jgi:quinol monooxygenase YgiN|tara:strand:- start:119 stop:283 length:165 start_codon:yes stop_codon:yes gene_type:complete
MFTVEFPLQDGKQSDLLALLAEALPDTRAFDGCISVETYAEQDASSQFCSLASA